ncbi:Gluconate 2-dehydrogenase subunit 3 [Halogeometricum rufum]|uniref:Gluconate 2-dehydrogenase subunit 3 n=1 Tax=Halogeometricum rufum TaxID=553469 RepID=A0A1I6J4L7_9EURY|nr:gluconate 2-dehydrogenase subunit 3 family protein [Halogeometricum rufum]SFR73888.1 Gluconate 2-dehydrogenase subunit 3 [Halogeometricum rufum]
MKLTRRDALGSLLAGGVGAAGAALFPASDRRRADGERTLTDADVRALTAVAETVYPTEVLPTDEFVANYVGGLPEPRAGIVADTVRSLDAYARREFGAPLASLSRDERDSVLRSMGVDRTGSDPEGTLPERVRYYVVNQLLYGLYSSPRGSSLVGIRNPVGYPGGYESYQRPPSADASMER